MNEETKNALNEFIVSSIEAVKQGAEFVKEQVPMVLQEYIAWGIVSNAVMAVVFAAVLYGMYRVAKWAYDNTNDGMRKRGEEIGRYRDDFGYVMAITLSALASIVAASCMVSSISDALMAAVAPRVYLIQTFTEMMKGGGCQ